MTDFRSPRQSNDDPFLLSYQPSELRIASEFLTNWLPFLSRGLCKHCTRVLSDRIQSLSTGDSINNLDSENCGENDSSSRINDESDNHSLGSWKDEGETTSMGSWKDGANSWSDTPVSHATPKEAMLEPILSETPSSRMSWADMAQQEDELESEEDNSSTKQSGDGNSSSGGLDGVPKKKTELTRDQREYLRFMNVKRKKDFTCWERVNGRMVNIVQGLELHTGVFSAVEQKRIVDFVYSLQEMGTKGQLKERTFTAPRKWMRGKGRQTIQFGCCYNYATDKNGNPPGILKMAEVDPLPTLFKVIIKRLIRWHVLPPDCVPDSCIVNIYDEEDCIPPHIDNHDFVRPFCTISFLSECNIVFGTDLKTLGPGDFSGDTAIPLPVGSVLVLNGNGADVAKHCVPAVPIKRISITFRRMDETKRPVDYAPDTNLEGLKPLCYDNEPSTKPIPRWAVSRETLTTPEQDMERIEPQSYDTETLKKPTPHRQGNRLTTRRGFRSETKRYDNPRHSPRDQKGTGRGPRPRVNLGG